MTPAGIERLKLDESGELTGQALPYDDKTGATVTHGPNGGNLTVGFGHNLGSPMIAELIEAIFQHDLDGAETVMFDCGGSWFHAVYGAARGDVFTMVQFNTGHVTEFGKMLAAGKAGNWTAAAAELMDSDAARGAPDRYERMKQALLTNSWATGEV